MIKVIEECPKPLRQVRCDNCGSLLEYGNADIHYQPFNLQLSECTMRLKGHYITCPIRENEVPATKIKREEDNQ